MRMLRVRWALVYALVVAALSGCESGSSGSGSAGVDAGASDAAAGSSGAVSTGAPGAAGGDEAPEVKGLELLKMTLTSAVKDKEPADRLSTARAGERVYAHLSLRNRTGGPREVRVEFQVNGVARTELTLDVGASWQWRTWGYNTLRSVDAGELTVIVSEVGGEELRRVSLPIKKGSK
ncbi:hypothetical protein [Chondromyces crocatus]|uniref:Lipoprotein n=1 Tax=Chondromyces crocatus TaxID=52 RepID=A0A0K1EEI5_CHOCO|nr:hypothetical protein [Chondromyces crocatus]AKT39285.1 uncharacterized protein CMC5_034330 [Chondromyces crocatus]